MDIKKKFAIYARVSRTDQILENQINPLVAYCERMGWDYEVFTEKESTRKSRPVQWDLYNRLLKKEFDGLLFYKLDRWARSLKELVTHMEALHEKGVILVSFMENIDLSTSSGKLMMQIMGSFAEFERAIIRERTMAGLDRARAQGKKLGRPFKGKNKKRPSRAQVGELMGKGFSIREMAKKLSTSKYWIEQVHKEITNIKTMELNNANNASPLSSGGGL